MANALIQESSGAIGSAIIRKLMDEGWNTISIPCDVSLYSQIADHGFETHFENPAEVEQIVYLVSHEVDSIDLLCYAAGDIAYQEVATMTAQDWQRILDANWNGVFFPIHSSLPLLSESSEISVEGQ